LAYTAIKRKGLGGNKATRFRLIPADIKLTNSTLKRVAPHNGYKVMKLQYKRWTYHINGHEIAVETAYSRLGWSQERLSINGREAARSGGWWRLKVELIGMLTTETPHARFSAVFTPGFTTVHCQLWAYGAPAPARARVCRGHLETKRGDWPAAPAAPISSPDTKKPEIA